MQNLEHSLKLNMTVPVYLFWGEEDLLMEEYIRKVAHVVAPDGESWSVETYHGDEASPDEILFALARSLSTTIRSSTVTSVRKSIPVNN